MQAATAVFVARRLLQASPSPAPEPQCNTEHGLSAAMTAVYIIICLILIILAGLMAG